MELSQNTFSVVKYLQSIQDIWLVFARNLAKGLKVFPNQFFVALLLLPLLPAHLDLG